MNEYKAIMVAVNMLHERNHGLVRETGVTCNPASMMLFHAENYLMKQADILLRGE